MDNNSIAEIHPDGTAALKKSCGGWTPKIHVIAADARTALIFSLSPGQTYDRPEGHKLLDRLGPRWGDPFLVMDRAYEGDETRQLVLEFGFVLVVPPRKPNRSLGVRQGSVQAS